MSGVGGQAKIRSSPLDFAEHANTLRAVAENHRLRALRSIGNGELGGEASKAKPAARDAASEFPTGVATTYRHAHDLGLFLARHLEFAVECDSGKEKKGVERRNQALLRESGRWQRCRKSREITSASLGVWGGRGKKKIRSRPRKRPAFEVRVFPVPGRAKCTDQPQPATECTATAEQFAVVDSLVGGATLQQLPIKPEGPVFCCNDETQRPDPAILAEISNASRAYNFLLQAADRSQV